MYYVYVLENFKGRLYIGQTADLERSLMRNVSLERYYRDLSFDYLN